MAHAQLFQSAGVDEQWQGVVLPWLRREVDQAWRDVRPTVILTPSRAESFYLRARLVEVGISFLGLRFWTPSDARAFLYRKIALGVELASEADLRLLARTCAQELAAKSDEPSLASVERDPRLFLRAYDLLLGAGWTPAKDGTSCSRKLARKLEVSLKESKVATQAGLHRLFAKQRPTKPSLRTLLVAGFNAAHWPLWDLLKATVAAAEDATVALVSPRESAAAIDELWIGSWEEEIGESVNISPVEDSCRAQPFSGWVGSYESGVAFDATAADFAFLAGADLTSHVQAIVLQTLSYLRNESCQRLGIIFPEPNALSLGVAEELRRLGIPIDDGTGYLQPGPFERRTWAAWLSLQEEPSVERLIEWLRAAEAEHLGGGLSLDARTVAELLENALGETLIDDLGFLALHFERSSKRRGAPEVAEFLRSRVQLPESGRFGDFWESTQRAVTQLGWSDRFGLSAELAPTWLLDSDWRLSRRTFLGWLKESTDSRERSRGAESNHFYGKVHLLIYAQMPGQTWTHLILTGLNDGRWPRTSEAAAFGSRYELMELNRQARALNRRGVTQGSQGEGHEAVKPEHGHCLLPLERQDLALRDLCAAVEETSEAICFAAMTAEAGRALLPSDFFATAYQAKTGVALDESGFSALAEHTAQWGRDSEKILPEIAKAKTLSENIDGTRVAFSARRNAEKAFGRFEFAYAETPRTPIQLPCKVWETAWNHPAAVWLERIVGVSAWPAGQLAWPRAVGTWVHRWLTAALSACREGDVADFPALLRAEVNREPRRLGAQLKEAKVTLYPWWNHVWGQARSIALGLGESLLPHLKEHYFFTEYPIPKPGMIALPGATKADFELRGKIDLLLISPGALPFDAATGDFADCGCWVIDFKTGAAKNLTPSRLDKGIGLQTMLYALAVRARGAQSIAVSLHTAETPLKPQVQIEQVEANFALFRSLDKLHRAGIFGMRPAPESEYGFAPAYPMATRPIAPAILQAKWALAHGAGDWWEES